MKLTTFILMIALAQVSAKGFGQKITLNETNAPIEKLLQAIKQQSGYVFFYDAKALENQKASIRVNGASVEEVMDQLTQRLPLTYKIVKNNIVLSKKEEPSFLDNIIARFQAIDVRGKVVDSLGNGLSGATVSVKNGKGSTSTDAGGNFYLKNVDEGVVLVVNYLGYITKEVVVNKEFMNVVLQQSESKLDEVQVIAYGTTTQRLGTGNVVSVKADDIERQPINNPLYALQGRVPGLIVTPTTGLAGGAVKLQIRGRNSLNFETEPLVVIDGLPVVNNIAGLGGIVSDLSTLSFSNINDIESIEILKDADATSIYGSRGANGVILITTKKGKRGHPEISVRAQTGGAQIGKKMDMMNTPQYLEMRKEAFANKNVNLSAVSPSPSNADVKMWDQNRYTDWQEKLLGETAIFQDAQATLSGGSTQIQYVFGGNYHRETTVFDSDNSDQKSSAHLSITGNSSDDKFKVTLTGSYLLNQNTLPGIDFTNKALTLPPNAPDLYSSNGDLNWEPLPSGISSWQNPYSELFRSSKSTISNLTASSSIAYAIMPSLTLKAALGFSELNGKSFRKTFPFEGRSPEDASLDFAMSAFNTTSMSNFSFEPQIDYKLILKNSIFSALVGASYQNTTQEGQSLNTEGITEDALLGNLGSATSILGSNFASQYKYAAVFGRINFTHCNRYIINLSARRDGSSRFGPGKQFGNFASAGIAWILTEESFMKNLKPWFSYGKLRASYGSAGNDGIDDYQYMERYEPISVTDLYQGRRGYRTAGLFNPYYAWETTKKLEIASETGFIRDRILFTAVYFRNRSSNQLSNYQYPTISGFGSPTFNLPATIQNSGWEFTLQTTAFRGKKFSWSTSFNVTSNRNKLVKYPNIENSSYYQSIIGQPFYGVQYAYKYGGVNSETGKYEFIKNDGIVSYDPSDNVTIDGGRYLRIMTQPKYYGGLSNRLSFKGLSVDFLIQFSKQTVESPLSDYFLRAGTMSNLPVQFVDRWTTKGDNRNYQKVFSSGIPSDYRNAINLLRSSSFNFVDGSFIRLKNISVSYDLPKDFIQKIGLTNMKFFLNGQNVWTGSSYKGLDPETRSIFSLPPLATATIGFQVLL